MNLRLAAATLAALCLVGLGAFNLTSGQESQQNLPLPPPPPPPPPAEPDPSEQDPTAKAPPYDSMSPESDKPWGLDRELLEALHRSADLYLGYSRRFVCDETARLAEYDGSGGVAHEDLRHYGYLLLSGAMGETVREVRSLRDRHGNYKSGDVDDQEPFPPAYAWVFLFGRFHEPYFAFRKLDTFFEGFDLVHEIQFRGSLSFTDGKDIRQWEGTVLVDAFKLVPLEVRAEPGNQKRRLEESYRRWAQSFNIIGLRTKPVPLGYQARVQYGIRRDGLSFPTELRYDTFRAVTPRQVVPVRASTRSYRDYRFTEVRQEEEVGESKP